jgi:hypothetical protein
MNRQFATDSHFVIGLDHVNNCKPCQDYAEAGVIPIGDLSSHGLHEESKSDDPLQVDRENGLAYSVDCDGCSSAGRTHIGACLYAVGTVSAILDYWETNPSITQETPHQIALRVENILETPKQQLKLKANDLFTTWSFAMLSPDGGFIHTWGDGIVAYKLRDGRILLTRFVWADNRPFYRAYASNPEHSAQFIKDHGGDLTAKRLTAEKWEYRPQQPFHPLDPQTYTLAEGIEGITTPLTSAELAQIEFLALFSDGPERFDQHDWKDVVVNLLAFDPEALTGEFAKRRMRTFVRDAQRKAQTRGPLDDLSYAVIRLIDVHQESAGENNAEHDR